MARYELKPPDGETSFDRVETQILSLFRDISTSLAPTLERFAQIQEERALQLEAAEARVRGYPGQHSQASALNEAAETARALELSLRAAAARETRRPTLVVKEWMISGWVVDPDGRPVSRCRVQ